MPRDLALISWKQGVVFAAFLASCVDLIVAAFSFVALFERKTEKGVSQFSIFLTHRFGDTPQHSIVCSLPHWPGVLQVGVGIGRHCSSNSKPFSVANLLLKSSKFSTSLIARFVSHFYGLYICFESKQKLKC